MVLRATVRRLDALLRRYYRIHEFSQDQDCLLRLAVIPAPRSLALRDRVTIARGEPVGDLHLWNERVPPIPPEGPGLAWAVSFHRRLRRSLEELAARVEVDPAYQHLRAFRAVGTLPVRGGGQEAGGWSVLACRFGFEPAAGPDPAGLWPRFLEFWENAFNLALVWAYNPASLRSRPFSRLRRVQFWMSRETLLARYGRSDRAVALFLSRR
ncbi:MAG: hypothetical protein AB1645_09275 [Bacillota bacterium]